MCPRFRVSQRARARPELAPRRDVELAERPSQVGLHRLLGDEQRLGDLPVRAARRGELDHAPLAWRQRVRPGALGPSGPDADRRELGPRPALQGSGAAAGGQREPLEQRLAGRAALPGGAERCAEVDQHTRMLEPRRRGFQHRERLRQPLRPFRAGADERVGAQRDADRTWRAERLCAAHLVGGQAASLVVAAELGQREGRRRSPRQHGRVLPAEHRVVERAAAQLLDRGFVVAGRGAKHAGGVAQLGARQELGVVPNAGSVDEPAQGVGGLVALEAREHRRRHRQDEELGAQQVGGELDRRLRVRLGGGQVSAA